MRIIYEPKGRAREYAALACNLYTGCNHGCLYCFAPAIQRMKKEDLREAANNVKLYNCETNTEAFEPEPFK